jgi:CheY-like chemotaxis protein
MPAPNRPRVVVVDRDPEFSAKVKRWFVASCLDFEVLPFSNGVDALDYIRQRRPDLIFTAYLVPQLDGLQFITAVRMFDPQVPIMMVSHVPVQAAALARGATQFCAKRALWAGLGMAVRMILGRSIGVST